MGGVYSRVNVRDNPCPQHTERLLRILDAHNRCRRLVDVAIPCIGRGTCRVWHQGSVRHHCGWNRRGKNVQSSHQIKELIQLGIDNPERIAEETQQSAYVEWTCD